MVKESKYTVNMLEFKVELHRESPKAYFIHDGAGFAWLPKSQCKWEPDEDHKATRGPKPGTIHVPEWIAKEKGMI